MQKDRRRARVVEGEGTSGTAEGRSRGKSSGKWRTHLLLLVGKVGKKPSELSLVLHRL